MNTKFQRALAILHFIVRLDDQLGSNIPPRLRDVRKLGRLIEKQPFRITRQFDVRMVYARQSPHTIAEVLMRVPGCEMTEVLLRGERVFIANRHQGRVEIYLFKPGAWELEFGVGHGGDTVPIIPGYFADPRCKDWQVFLESPENEWPPRYGVFGLPIHDDKEDQSKAA